VVQLFKLLRHKDISGVSGEGVVAYGVTFPNGKTVLYWNTETSSIVVYDSVEDCDAVHLHGGATERVPMGSEED
jgi:hypothetical protein